MVIEQFEYLEKYNLWETLSILKRGEFSVHESIYKVILKGSRGILGGYTDSADLDIILLSDLDADTPEHVLRDALKVTLDSWRGHIPLDLKIIVNSGRCDSICMDVDHFHMDICHSGIGCAKSYDLETGFKAGQRFIAANLYPIITIWEKRVEEVAPRIMFRG